MSITESEVLFQVEAMVDRVGAKVDRSFSESEEAELAIFFAHWLKRNGVEVVEDAP